jgi:hypothetical protein
MLDVHPPHQSAHTWPDFFIHIATIVVGLLIAVGLEQTVEYLHLRHTMREAREHIRDEVKVNQRVLKSDQDEMARLLARMNHNLELLRAAGKPNAEPDATLDFTWNQQNFFDAAYNGAKESGALSRMPYNESATYEDAYSGVTIHTAAMLGCIEQIYAAKAMLHGRKIADLSPTEIATLESAVESVIGKAEYSDLVLNVEGEEWDAILAGKFRNDISGSGT